MRKSIPWNLTVTPDLTETRPPSAEEIAFIRHFAPAESVGRMLRIELTLANLAKKAQPPFST